MNAVVNIHLADLVRRARALVFDFDGTLVDSNRIKQHAFELCFEEFSEQRHDILAYCWNNHHVPRTEKFRHVYEKILGLPYTEDVAAMLCERFAEASTRQIIRAPEIRGAERFLSRERGARIMALLSSTPQETLLDILTKRGWKAYFEAIKGAPVVKSRWLVEFQRRWRLAPRDLLFLGDTPEDAASAREAGCPFIAVGNHALNSDSIFFITDFTEIIDL